MSIDTLISEIDAENSLLQQARALLAGGSAATAKKRGRPAKSAVAAGAGKPSAAKPVKKKKRNLRPEGRARIAAAVKARWAKQKKTAK